MVIWQLSPALLYNVDVSLLQRNRFKWTSPYEASAEPLTNVWMTQVC